MIWLLLFILVFGGIAFYIIKVRFFDGKKSVGSGVQDFIVLEIVIPREEDTGKETHFSALAAEHLFASLHGLLRDDASEQEVFSFEIASTDAGTKFYLTAPQNVVKFIESQVYAQYPHSQIKVAEDYVSPELIKNSKFDIANLNFAKEHFFPIKVFRDFEMDPMTGIMSTLSELKPGEHFWLQYLIRPVADGWQESGHTYMSVVTGGSAPKGDFFLVSLVKEVVSEIFRILAQMPRTVVSGTNAAESAVGSGKDSGAPKLTAFQELELKAVENKLAKMGFEVGIRVVSIAPETVRVESNMRAVKASFRQFTSANLNEFVMVSPMDAVSALQDYKDRRVTDTFILTNEELATLVHLPGSRSEAPSVTWVASKQGEPPSTLPIDNCTYIGETIFRGKKVRFGMRNEDDRLRHMYLIGKTGTGKSTLLEMMAMQDIMDGAGIGILDPHGETIDKMLERIPDNRIDDVVVIDPSDFDRPVGLNLLEISDASQKNLMASALVAAIKQHFDYSWGPRLEYLLNYALLTLLEVPGTSLLGITRLLEDKNYQNFILHFVNDPVVKKFWETEYKEMKGNQKLVTEAIAPIQNKVNRFLASSTIRNILGQKQSTIDLWDIMNNQKILLINLSKGKIGADNANLLGALLVSRIQFMALQRANIPYELRKPFYLYVDEFQNFATGSFEEILSESRKYKLGLYLTHQYTAQLPEEILSAVFGNVGTIATFSLGAPDAAVLANEFAPYFNQEDIISLEKFHIYIKLMIDGMTSLPFSAKILLPWVKETELAPKTNNRDRVIEASRQKYGVDRTFVEEKIDKWVGTPFDKGMEIALENKLKDQNAQH